MIRKEPSKKPGHLRVTFEIPASVWADHVYLVGNFYDCECGALPLHRARNGIWQITLELPVQRQYEFHYRIDDHRCTDFHADGFATGTISHDTMLINSLVDTTWPPENLASAQGQSLVREAAFDRGMDFAAKQHL